MTVCDSESVLAVYVLADFETLSVQCTVYSVLYSVHCTVHCTVYTVQYTVQCTLYSVQCTVWVCECECV